MDKFLYFSLQIIRSAAELGEYYLLVFHKVPSMIICQMTQRSHIKAQGRIIYQTQANKEAPGHDVLQLGITEMVPNNESPLEDENKQKKSRKRKSLPKTWKRYENKENKNKGKAYKTYSGKKSLYWKTFM
ncbi:unnamed protein product [Acanthoscelides obtectus]|uniref:Uncharacterized protein n=1 Tax=Acanthoscelides obtectus TaxID=200917 RepID=A0A9P0JJE0_ACAOB|nr:unnamed protein product [Acanthoscelides obtectus]CAK1678855.1 hypothetical protein AOBTE_LOCUS32045 [Acanthoscelides obtectus]